MTLPAGLIDAVLSSKFVAVEGARGAGKSYVISELMRAIPNTVAIPDCVLPVDLLDDEDLGQATYLLQDAMKYATARQCVADGDIALVERFTISMAVFHRLHPLTRTASLHLAAELEAAGLLGRAPLYIVVDRDMETLREVDKSRVWRTPSDNLAAERAAYLDPLLVASATGTSAAIRFSNARHQIPAE